MIFNVQRCSNHDGYGLRTTVFMKGCPLSCKWCANPESQSFRKEIMEAKNRCVGCMVCRDECPAGAIRPDGEGYPRIDRTACQKCFHCTEICYAGSKYIVGREPSVDDLFREIEKDRVFFTKSGGGVTFSGGEPLAQPELLHDIAAHALPNRRYALLENGSWSVTSGREMKKILEPLKGWSEVSAPITVKSALREDQLAAIDALADALAADVKG